MAKSCQCGAVALTNRSYCAECTERRRQERKEKNAPKPCKCGAIAEPGKVFCRECIDARMARGLAARSCTVCGARKSGDRRTCATCSPECQAIAKKRNDEIQRASVEVQCIECGAITLRPPSMASRRFCSRECAAAHRGNNAKKRTCKVCGRECEGHRLTCSDECLQKLMAQRSSLGCRSECVRSKRRKQRADRYRGRDKAEVIAALTAKQGGKCAICGSAGASLGNGAAGLVLDHDHRTGAPRAMLCGKCNAALGLMGESPEAINELYKYATRHAQASALT